MTQTREDITAFRTDERSPSAAIAAIDIHVPTRGNRKLDRLIENANADQQLKAWWLVAGVNATKRLGMSDHGWVHIQVVSNI
jgi:metal-dependent HD superfamily phosphatase/phosphodiesterase